MKCAREGYPFIIICLISAILTWLATLVFGLWMSIIAILLSMLTILVAWFFRDPERDQLVDQDIVTAPADGKILAIDEIHEPSYFDGPCRRITIFLSIFNVHIQRAPIEGKVIHKYYILLQYQQYHNKFENDLFDLTLKNKMLQIYCYH